MPCFDQGESGPTRLIMAGLLSPDPGASPGGIRNAVIQGLAPKRPWGQAEFQVNLELGLTPEPQVDGRNRVRAMPASPEISRLDVFQEDRRGPRVDGARAPSRPGSRRSAAPR